MKATLFSLLIGVIFALFGVSCQRDDARISPLTGTWVETSRLSDTIIFTGDKWFTLSRKREIRGGHVLPEYGAGIYEFKLTLNQISLYNTLSSCYCFNAYYFNVNDNVMKIGDFYASSLPGPILTFKKIE